MFTDAEKLACIEREIAMRRAVYRTSVRTGAMPQRVANREIALMEAIAEDYRAKVRGPGLFDERIKEPGK